MMDVARATFNVLANLKPDPKWKPGIGRLFVRMIVAPWTMEIQIGVATSDTRYMSIASIRNWRAECEFGGYVHSDTGDIGSAMSGALIVRRYACSADFIALRKLWASRFGVTFDEFVRSTWHYVAHEDDRAMIQGARDVDT